MKKSLLVALLTISAFTVFSQDYKKISTAYLLGKYAEAKIEADKLMANPQYQAKPEVWFWYSTVYSTIYDDAALKNQFPTAGETAFTSFVKYAEMDPTFKVMNENAPPGPGKVVIDNLYRGNLKQGIATFDKKQWDSSFLYFGRASYIGDLVTKFDWRGNKQTIDTTTVLFTGYAAQNAKKTDEAAKYYSRIADLKIKTSAGAGEIKDIYEYLLYYYMQKKDVEKFNKYLALARELFPAQSNTWADYETDYTEKFMSLAEKTAAYDKADAAGTLTSSQYMAYGVMFYNIKEEEREKLDSTQQAKYRTKAEEAFMKSYNKDNTNGLAAYNAGLINYNDWVSLDDTYESNIKRIGEINKNKPAEKDPKKKAAIDAKAKKDIDAVKAENAIVEKKQQTTADKSIQWMELAYKALSAKTTLERMEKSMLGKSIDDLANLYMWKRDKAKGNAAEYDKYDALYKKYDALHGKY